MPKEKNQHKSTAASDEKFRDFFTTTVADIPAEMVRREEEAAEEHKGLFGRLFGHAKPKQAPQAGTDLELPTGEVLLGADALAKPDGEEPLDLDLTLRTADPGTDFPQPKAEVPAAPEKPAVPDRPAPQPAPENKPEPPKAPATPAPQPEKPRKKAAQNPKNAPDVLLPQEQQEQQEMQQLKDMLNGMAAKPKPVEETLEPICSVDVPLDDPEEPETPEKAPEPPRPTMVFAADKPLPEKKSVFRMFGDADDEKKPEVPEEPAAPEKTSPAAPVKAPEAEPETKPDEDTMSLPLEPLDAPETEPTETPAVTQAPAVTEAPTAAPDPDPTAAPAPEPDQPDDQPAEQSEDDREGEAHGRPRRNEPTFDVDLDFGGEGDGDAGGDATIDHGGEGQIDSNIDLTVPSITLSDRDSITAARSSLNGSLASIIDGVSSLNTNTGSHTQALIQDVQAISSQLNKIGDTLAGAADQSEDDNNLFEDVSDSDTDGDTEGKVFNCMNLGEVNADINAGGITGAMARENDLDPEDDTKTSGSSSLNVTYKTRIVVRDCINKGAVNVKKKGGGGIVGSMDMGSVLQSYNFGNLESDDADYVGGIAGQSKSIIRRSAAKCRLSGDNYVGGIAGSGFTITGSRSFVLADGDEYVGAIAGGLESSNSITNLNSALQDSESEQSGNYFVSETLGGIDGVSYAGQAEPLSFQEFCDLTAQEGMPDEFRNVTLNFVASQVTVAAVTVEYGAAFDMANAPELPAKGGYTAEWSDFDHDHVVFDQTIEAVYTPLDSVVQSGDTRNGLPILLAEGAFGTAEVTLTPSSESPGAVGTLLECWEITLPEDRSDSHVLHYLAPSDNTVVYLRDADGSWRKVDTTEDGSYLVFTAMTDEATLAAVEKPGIPLPILIGGAVAAVLLVILSILGHKHRKKRLTEKAEQERKRAEETENG